MRKGNLIPLLRIQRMMAWRGFRDRLGGGKSKWGLLLLPLLGLGFIPMIGLITGMYVALFVGAKLLGQSHVLLTVALTAGQLVCLGFGIFYLISVFYFSKDLPVLVPLPIRPSEIVLAKFIGILSGEYMTIAPVVLPALLVYGVMGHVSLVYWPFALLIFLLLPIVPLVIASVFSILLMRVTNLRRNRDMWRVVGALVGVLFALGVNMFSQFGQQNGKFNSDLAVEQIKQILQQQQSLMDRVTTYVPTSTWATNALREGAPTGGVLSFFLFAGVAVAALLLMLWAAEKLFFGGLLGGDDSQSSGKVFTGEELSRETGRVRPPLGALLQREMRLLNRTPSFLMAAALPPVLMPIMIMLPMSQTGELSDMLGKVGKVAQHPLVPVFAIGLVLFMNMISNVGATAVSREGKYFWISRSIPVAPRVQIQAKLLHSLMFTGLNVLIALGILQYLGLLRPLTAVSVLAGGTLASLAANYGAVTADVLRPYLKWTDPQQAMKGNINILLAVLFTFVLGAVAAGVTVVLYLFARPALVPGVILFFALVVAVLSQVAGALADRKYAQYEE